MITPAFALLALLMAGQAQQLQRDQFVYGGGVVDVLLGVERGFDAADRPVTDCSNAEFVCIQGDVLDIVLPRTCPSFDLGQEFSLAGTTTRVIANYGRGQHGDKNPSHYAQAIRLLANPTKPWVVYVYARQGVVGIYYDPERRADLLARAQSGGIDALDAQAGSQYWRLTSLMGAAICS